MRDRAEGPKDQLHPMGHALEARWSSQQPASCQALPPYGLHRTASHQRAHLQHGSQGPSRLTSGFRLAAATA